VIEFLSGTLAAVEPMAAIVDMHGVGLRVEVTPSDAERLVPGAPVTFLTHLLVSGNDAVPRLIGFTSEDGRTLFRMLIAVAGIGPSNALRLLSARGSPLEVAQAIATGDAAAIKVKGVGPKLAKRVISELKDKVAPLTVGIAGAVTASTPSGLEAELGSGFHEAYLALRGLEFDADEARRMIERVRPDTPEDTPAEQIVRAVLLLV
jgi:holliday junction DNA helicase RuvA